MVVRKTALIKDIFRDIQKNLGRFLSIVGIVSLGVAFFAGLKIAPEDMRYTADKYYDDYNLMDIRVVSNLGLTNQDLKEIKKIEGINEAMGSYSLDAITTSEDNEIVVKVHSFESEDQINGARLMEGRFPRALDECLVEYGKEGLLDVSIGSTIKLSSGKDDPLSNSLNITEYKVVGKVTTPYYLSFEKGNTNIGSGKVKDFIMVAKENFKLEVFTDIYALVDGAKEMNSYKDDYFDHIEETTTRIEKISKKREIVRYEELLNDIKSEIDEGKEEYFREKDKAEEELNKAFNDLETGRRDMENGFIELKNNEDKFYKSIKEGKDKIAQGERDIENGEKELKKAIEEFEQEKVLAEKEFAGAEEEIRQAEDLAGQLEASVEEMEAALKNPDLSEDEQEGLRREIQEIKGQLLVIHKKVEEGKNSLEAGKKEILQGEKELDSQKDNIVEAREKLENEKNNLEKLEMETLVEFRKARAELESAKVDIEKGEKEYLEAKEEADIKLSEAWEKIEDGEKEIKKIEKARWYILDRNSHYSYLDYGGAADRIDSLAKVFPVFFALVAALVCLTTMTRMVDEQRINIGTLKALGYTRANIVAKYIIYALLATLTGSILGLGLGYTVFPIVIFNAYGMMYELPAVSLRFNMVLALGITLVSILLTTMTSFIASSNELKENPATLMRPKAPKLGKTVLIERIPFIWDRFNFSYKVTIRNILRYKRRFFMTVFGIAGCTALILTAFGVRDSIRTTVDKQYGELFNYDLTIGIEKNIENDLSKLEEISSYTAIYREGAKVEKGKNEMDISLIVAEDRQEINNFISLQDRKSGRKITIPDNGVIISEQIGKILDVKIGDEIKLTNSDDEDSLLEIIDITENYTFNYVYISSEQYSKIFEKNLEYDEILAKLDNNGSNTEEKLSREIVDLKGVNSISFNSNLRDNFEDTIDSLNYVVLVMIISAGALAFVVLYNLTNVNISERIREIATIKVLGFYDNEVSEYIYRENIILTSIGILFGLLMGVFLHRYIMLTVEMENIMFGLKLNYKSYIYSAALTFIFAILVNLAMHYKLKKVKMVESLKSVD